MNFYEHHIGDYDQATAHLSAVEDGIYSRMIRWYMADERALPSDVAAITRRVRAHSRDEKAAVKTILAEFFELLEDGYHQRRCDEEVARYQDKQRKARASAEARWGKSERNGDASSAEDANDDAEDMRTHMRTHPPSNAPRARTPTRADARSSPQSPDTSPQAPGEQARVDAATSRALVRPPADDGLGAGHDGGHSDDAGAPLEGSGTRYGLAARAMRAKGCPATPGAPRLRNLVDAGASLEEFEAVAQEAVEKGKGPEWALQALANRRAEAALPPKGGTGRVTGHVTGGHRNRQRALEDSNRAVGEAWLAAQEAKDRETH